MSQENVEIVVRALAAWNEGDFDGWLETAHPDIEWVPALVQLMERTQTTYQGIPGLRRYWDDMHAI
jgi:ketosteroid isomerase-like protein